MQGGTNLYKSLTKAEGRVAAKELRELGKLGEIV
jgi:hypothetical protein